MRARELNLVSHAKILEEIEKAYATTFLEKLMEIPAVHVYVFGGLVVDLSLNKPWKDLDLRVIYDNRNNGAKEIILDVIKENTAFVQQFEFPGGAVYRVRAPKEKDTLIDITVSDNFEEIRIDSKICAIFIDLKSGEVRELYNGSIDDFKSGVICPIDEQEGQLEMNPLYLFRTLKLAVKTGFAIDQQFEKLLRMKKSLIKKALADTISYLRDHGKDSIGENFLGSIFGGLKQDAPMYVRLLLNYGFFEEVCLALQTELGLANSLSVKIDLNVFKNATTFEEKLSLFLSGLARSISDEPAVCFEKIKHAFAFDTNRSDGNEFVVDPAKIVYTS